MVMCMDCMEMGLFDELGEVLAFAGEGLLVGFGVFDGFVD